MRRLAIIGTGISGLGCAHFLARDFDLVVFEKDSRIGGHAHTVAVDEGDGQALIDTGFMVYNEVTYPNLVRLFHQLGVKPKPTAMSFSVQVLPRGLEYAGNSLSTLFSQRRNIANPRFLRLLWDISRFHSLAGPWLQTNPDSALGLGAFAQSNGLSRTFLDDYLLPMSGALWSAPHPQMLEFPAAMLIRFFRNHNLLGMGDHFSWLTLDGGSRTYVEALAAPLRDRIRTSAAVTAVSRVGDQQRVVLADGSGEMFDAVVFACHSDQVKTLVQDPSPEESAALRPFDYRRNRVVLHSDASVMPKTRRAWSSWNSRLERFPDGTTRTTVHYWMNSLQQVSRKRDYFVSVADPGERHLDLDPRSIHRELVYDHPVFTPATHAGQKRLQTLNHRDDGQVRGRYYCGAYFRYGFHEDGLLSAVELSENLLGRSPWT